MTWGDAASYGSAMASRNSLLTSPGSIFDKAKQLSQFDQFAAKPASGGLTVGAVVRSAIGGAFGLGLSRMAGGMLGLSDRTQDKVDSMAMGLGGAYNSGLFKGGESAIDTLEERRHAFRLGFMKGAMASGLIKSSAMLAVTPELLVSPITMTGNMVSAAGNAAGSVIGGLDSPDEDDEDLAKLNAQKELLRKQLMTAEAERKTRMLKQLLAKRVAA